MQPSAPHSVFSQKITFSYINGKSMLRFPNFIFAVTTFTEGEKEE